MLHDNGPVRGSVFVAWREREVGLKGFESSVATELTSGEAGRKKQDPTRAQHCTGVSVIEGVFLVLVGSVIIGGVFKVFNIIVSFL